MQSRSYLVNYGFVSIEYILGIIIMSVISQI